MVVMEKTVPTITLTKDLLHHEHDQKEAVGLTTVGLHDMFIVAKHNEYLPCHGTLLALFSPLAARLLSEVPCCIAPTLFLTYFHKVNIRTLLLLLRSGDTVLSQNVNADIKEVKEIAKILEISLTDINIPPYLDHPMSGTFHIKKEASKYIVKAEIKEEVEELNEEPEIGRARDNAKRLKVNLPKQSHLQLKRKAESQQLSYEIKEKEEVNCEEQDNEEQEIEYIEEDETDIKKETSKYSVKAEIKEEVEELIDENKTENKSSCGISKIEKAGTVHPKVAFGMETNDEDMIELETSPVFSEISFCKIVSVSSIFTTVQEGGSKSSQNYDGLDSISSIVHKNASYHSREGTSISPTQLHVDDTCINSDPKDNRDHNCKPVKIKMKYKTNKHTRALPFPCEFCPKRFRKSTKLRHHRMIHTGEEPFQYVVSPKKPNKLKKRTRIHSGEKPSKCETPKYVTTNIYTGEKPFQCMGCKKRFFHSDTLSRHKKICVLCN